MEGQGPAQPRKIPRQARARATVDAILLAAAHILKAEGTARATTRRIAERAGVSIGSLYQYFPNKEAIVAAVRELHDDYYEAEVRTEIERSPERSLRASIASTLGRMVELHATDAPLHAALCSGLRAIEPAEEAAYRALVREYLETHAHELRPIADPDLTAFVAMRAMEALVHGVALDAPERLRHPRYVEELTRLIVGYLEGAPR